MEVPQVLAGRYAIEREIGRGGMAVVYLGRDLRHLRDVAIKLFRVENDEPSDGSQRFLQEIQIAARLAHPNILPLHDSGEADGFLYYVMPYVPGETLRRRMEREGALPVADALRIAGDVADALAYAHSHGVIHRDIKPENILFISDHAVVADFGIARAISAGGFDELRMAGPVGTPTYMSPEQARGESRVDGRSDVYSLGCVLYEMLTGEPPFRGSTPEEVVVQHLEVEPQPVQVRRPTLSADLQDTIGKSLAKHPADRYQTAQQMADALGRLAGGSTQGGSIAASRLDRPDSVREPQESWLRRWAAPGIAALGIVVAVLWTTALRQPSLDTSLYMVAPLLHGPGVPPTLSGDQCRRLLHEALSRWDGIKLTDRRWVDDRLDQAGGHATLEEMLRLARLGGAGRLLAGEVSTWGDSIRVRGVVYDVSRGPEVLREKTVTLSARDLNDAEQKFAELADSLILPRPQIATAATGLFGTRVLGALVMYDSAHASLAQWELDVAARQFRAALAADPNYGLAHLWLAQTMNWQGADADEWKDEALAGARSQPPLVGQEALWSKGLVALGEARYQDACKAYDEMLKRDTLDFRAWFGRGECRSQDHVVVRDPKSESGWAFRASYQAAINDYQKALMLVPSVHRAYRGAAFQRLASLFYAESHVYRWGRPLAPDTGAYAGFPWLTHDTVAFVPWPIESLNTGNRRIVPEGPASAVDRNMQSLMRVTSMWVKAFPESPDAWEARAGILEVTGDLEGTSDTAAALPALGHALRLAATRADSLRIRTFQTQILVKLGRFDAAARAADSVLAAAGNPTPEEADQITGLAALTGRAGLLATLMRLASSQPLPAITDEYPAGTHPGLRASLAGLMAYSVLGGPPDSAMRMLRVVDDQIRAYVAQNQRAAFRDEALQFPMMMLHPSEVAGLAVPAHPPRMYLRRFQYYLHRGDTTALRAALDTIKTVRSTGRPATVAVEAVYHEAVLSLAVRDTAGAIRQLDQSLNSLPAADHDFINRPAASGSLVRAMMLRAELAVRLHDLPTARRWAAGAAGLWAKADPGFQPGIDSMRRIASGNF
ncbi:MAG TPA: serine/threonine-protein kinase [Gemmatimonadales bacterium]|nr:serine/threonine-protein kinase [Gemmatimonadales bacterium]